MSPKEDKRRAMGQQKGSILDTLEDSPTLKARYARNRARYQGDVSAIERWYREGCSASPQIVASDYDDAY